LRTDVTIYAFQWRHQEVGKQIHGALRRVLTDAARPALPFGGNGAGIYHQTADRTENIAWESTNGFFTWNRGAPIGHLLVQCLQDPCAVQGRGATSRMQESVRPRPMGVRKGRRRWRTEVKRCPRRLRDTLPARFQNECAPAKLLCGTSATIRTGAPEPFSNFIGNTTTMAPACGTCPGFATFSRW
jgi:hypothetical protein